MTTLPIGDTCEDVAAQRCFRTEVSSSDIQTKVVLGFAPQCVLC